MHQAPRRPLTKDEVDRLQQLLACMRMICDTPAILDPTCRVSPKLEELEKILADLLEEPDRKIIVFSEWEHMLELVRELAAEMGVETAWHTGSVPQQRRRAEILRFKKDPDCRLFLSTDSGSVGLNLQVANAVVNVDLPWNPAKLEQRIARAWRKHQTRSVTVVNLVCENSIEHGIMFLLGQKQALADGLLDPHADAGAVKLPSGRAAMIERLQAMMSAEETAVARIVTPDEAIAEELKQRHGDRALLLEARRGADGRLRVLAVLDLEREGLDAETRRLAERGSDVAVELIDRETYLAMRRLQAVGMLQAAEGPARVLHRAQDLAGFDQPAGEAARAAELRRQAERSLQMARVLAAGGFPEEAPPLLARALGFGAAAKLSAAGELPAGTSIVTPAQMQEFAGRGALPSRITSTLAALWSEAAAPSAGDVGHLLDEAAAVLASCQEGGSAALVLAAS